MGRHYDGDIEGKFWFAVQSSDDGEYFGAIDITEENTDSDYHDGFVDYVIYFSDIDRVKDGIDLCKRQLRGNYLILNEFFLSNNGYNDEMIIEHYQKTRGIHINEGFLREQLTIFARLDFGTQILLYFNENPGEDCHFTAEM
tara:strand:+ start:3344 stop:3769 length:426 start_codon:yes stop_codon:yes gene_type:complete